MSESKPLSASQIIDHVVNHFSKNPRSLDKWGSCVYNGADGSRCAFAILCSNPEELPEGYILWDIARIKPEFDGYSKDFYRDIQRLHDRGDNWIKTETGNELTQMGIEKVKELKEKHK